MQIETTSYFIEEIKQNELMSKKHIKACRAMNYIEHLLILISTVHGCVSIYAFASLVGYKFCNRIKNCCNNCRN